LPDDGSRQNALQSYVSALAGQRPEIAATYADGITDPDKRNEAIENIAQGWLQSSPNDAKKWLMNTSLPDDRKQALLTAPASQPNLAPAPPPIVRPF
jgi:hypothetical protein